MTMRTFDLAREAREHILITAHRGTSAGNIPCNTLAAYDAALYDGADMIELDVGRSKDGTLYIFHEGCERAQLGLERRLGDLTDEEISVLRYLNPDRDPTEHPVYTVDEAFRYLKGRCYINVDKFALYMEPITEAVRRHGLQDQVVVKTDGTPALLDQVEKIAPDLNYIAILKEKDECTEEALRRSMRYIGVEAVFAAEDAPICQPEYIKRMHDLGMVMWGNGIVYNYKAVLSAGHSDDTAVSGDPEKGWGWLADRGFDIIQTDWPLHIRTFLEKTGRL